ncbi:mannose/fructose/sorbose PTS transporter subunit IIB [Tetragenococcus koreensis]|uniref:mannose/fructose/sorbose PTS transporter subunit IIB n=1 Tax=Tetragenococcus koreensis TaxID=290335 RepID=UPI001F212D49|nr:mannose/fructose/sorbose PTS transporter subunit IIB [Tetragenococcus koreensis]MDN6640453.1 mannose/fructose/sorbose PTS transporter subunit IIB [Tetragenococcus sp.]MCF1585981.1 mannose/fructose/sorbose PTS transporter subunit IIB [Tetragenococcus koreensis]MCF1615558.1 mannose/fructose/sorbose PTS transporter subunit IIB [Tetragenococcus koreensis]MCF1619160.1 mannose/fructose/sorbose PTS transporter subunit IIB [Tetragenococcus koreensis]MCF1625355.1 mannose/fructose/sorbose PTS transpo
MDIRLARIDDRLIHGQVATVWAKEAGAQRIIVVSEEVASDKVRSTLVKQAAPPGIKANIVNVEKAVRVYNNPKYENETVFYLFTNPTEVLQMVEQGVPIKTLNIGGMQYSEGRTQVTKSVSVKEEDVQAFKKLAERGVELDFRVVATDARKDFTATLKEAGF